MFRIIWAVVLTCHGAANNFVSLTVLRVLLGVFESTISPGFTLITGIWYKPSEHALRTCIWFSGNAFAAIFGGLLSYAIGHIQHSVAAWRVSTFRSNEVYLFPSKKSLT